jgi:hypothetical protein
MTAGPDELCKKGAFKYRKIERPIENIQVHGTTVVVTGHVKMDVIIEGKPRLLNSGYTNVWIKGAKGWQKQLPKVRRAFR